MAKHQIDAGMVLSLPPQKDGVSYRQAVIITSIERRLIVGTKDE
jgi:hypothetical protein